ncbi:MAG TPA: c-type cytochrome [Caldimonas sp.]|nr:c-type cytochrome [Caldimonas sp.]HEX4233864.1 c-type cytochrome [Caldimonas sp.]
MSENRARRPRSKGAELRALVWRLGALALVVSATPVTHAQTAAPPKAEVCAACHGPGGKSTDPMYPILAGQTSRYLYLELRDFQEGRRSDPQMSPMAADLTRDEMHALADYFAQQTPPPQPFNADPAKAALGKAKADETLCTMCHLGGFAGQNEIPRVAGQHYAYIVKQLADFKARKRTNDAGNMTSVASTLSEQDIENLAQYLVGL